MSFHSRTRTCALVGVAVVSSLFGAGVADGQTTIVLEVPGRLWPTVVGGDEPEGALFYATSRDGMRFTPRQRIPTAGGPKPTHPQIAIGPEGRVAVSWDESVGGQRVAAMREVIRVPGRAVRFGDLVTIAAGPGVNHPVLAVTDTSLVAVWASGGDPSRVEVRRLLLP